MENFLNQQDEEINPRIVSFSTESQKESTEKLDEDEPMRKIQKPNDGNKVSEEEPSPPEDQGFVSEKEETCSDPSGLVKGIIGAFYKG